MLTALAAILLGEAAYIATIPDVAAAAPLAFVAGVAVGFLVANHYRLVKRDDQDG
jgi:hypothetical protein